MIIIIHIHSYIIQHIAFYFYITIFVSVHFYFYRKHTTYYISYHVMKNRQKLILLISEKQHHCVQCKKNEH